MQSFDAPPTVVEIAQELIRRDSITPNEAGTLDYVEQLLTPLGFVCERFVFSGDGSYPVDNLYARFGDKSPNICFAGHVDVVPVGDLGGWRFDPFSATIEEGYLNGRGAEDMKGAIAAFISAACQLIANNKGLNGSVSLLLTGDEEADAVNGTTKVLQALRDKGERLDFAIVGEPTNPEFIGQMAKIGRRGSVTYRLKVNGVQGHAAYPDLADNPITRLINILHRLKSQPLDGGTEHFLPSNLEVTSIDVGNPASNVIPASASACFNVRFNDLHTSSTISSKVESICREYAADFNLEVRVTGESFITTPGILSDNLVKAVQEITGHTPSLSTTGGTSDARFIKDYCPVIEFGTTGRTPHKVNERVAIEDLHTLQMVYKRFLELMLS
jgi:succinyl-diaminopimelate desuccinylase